MESCNKIQVVPGYIYERRTVAVAEASRGGRGFVYFERHRMYLRKRKVFGRRRTPSPPALRCEDKRNMPSAVKAQKECVAGSVQSRIQDCRGGSRTQDVLRRNSFSTFTLCE